MKGQPKRTLQHLFSGSREPDDLRSCLRKADPGMRGISRRSAAFSAGTEKAFVRTLGLTAETTVDPDHSHLFAAMGAAMESTEKDTVPIDTLIERLKNGVSISFEMPRLPALFESHAEYEQFCCRHARASVARGELSAYRGNCYLGIDAGSTTTKMALIGENGELLYSYYTNNNGNPIEAAKRVSTNCKR